jgi:hypothetical protein
MTTPPFKQEVLGILGITTNGATPKINAIHVKQVTCSQLRCEDIWITGNLMTPVQGTFVDGSVSAPSITFTNDTTTGFYLPAIGSIGAASAGSNLFTVSSAGFSLDVPITTAVGDLVLDPAGGNINCSGKSLTNVGGIFINPDRYEVTGAVITTTDNTPTVILTVPLTIAGYSIAIDIVYVDGTSVASANLLVQANNASGTATMVLLTSNMRSDVSLSAAGVAASASGTNIIVTATGIAATSIKWQAAAAITRVLH